MNRETTANEQVEALVLVLQGRVDGVTSAELENKVVSLLNAGHSRLVLDLARVDYVSSAGLRVFLMAAKRLKGHGRIVFAGLQEPVRQVFNLTGMAFRVDLFPTLQEAIDHALAAPVGAA
jgi:anti-anti-sigma factor